MLCGHARVTAVFLFSFIRNENGFRPQLYVWRKRSLYVRHNALFILKRYIAARILQLRQRNWYPEANADIAREFLRKGDKEIADALSPPHCYLPYLRPLRSALASLQVFPQP